jgi:DNA-directed RNA polymerase subunit RPC12/RpoP
MAPSDSSSGEVRVLICLECGKEYFFEQQEQPTDLKCEKCGNEVFRPYSVATRGDDAEQDFHETTDRDTDPDHGPGEVKPGDVRDLDRI